MPQTQEDRNVQEVVRAHAGWVFACAKRRVRDDALAEDVAQAVFILFWQKRESMEGEAKVTGWLYRAVRYCAANALRLKQIRQRHEREAAMAALADGSAGEVDWNKVSPELAWAMDRLREKDRAAVLLRFYRQMSFAEVGQSLGISEEAAKKRVQRALESLRGVLAKKGVMAGAAALGVVMAQNVTAAAPAGLMEAVTAAVEGGGAGSAGIIAKGAIKMMAWAKMKVAAVVVVGAVLAAGGVVTVIVQTSVTAPIPAGRPGIAVTSNASDWRSQLDNAYGLGNDEIVKRIKPPFLPARATYWKTINRTPSNPPPDLLLLEWNGQLLYGGSQAWGLTFGELRGALYMVIGCGEFDVEGPADLLAKPVPGDWIVRSGVTEQDKVAALVAILRRDVDPAITIQKQQVEREMIVVRGDFQFQPHPDAIHPNEVFLYSDPYVAEDRAEGGGQLDSFLQHIGQLAGERVVNEMRRPWSREVITYRTLSSCHLTGLPRDQARNDKLDSLLKNIMAQTGLTLTRETRKVIVWVVDRKKIASAEAPTTAPTAADLTVRPGDGVGGVKIGMLMTDVERVLGAPTRKLAPSGTMDYIRLGMFVIPRRGTNRVRTIVGERPKTLPAFTGLTAEALGIGSTRKQIVAVYGEPDHATTKPGTTFENLRYDGRGISWTLNEGQCIQVAVMAGTRTAATRP